MSLEAGQRSLVPGYRLDRYELLCPIAEGGMAQVWVARLQRKHGFEKLVAVKTILPKFAEDIRFQQMFLDEARIASRIEHTNVAQITDLGDEHDVLYLVMEWVDGEALSKLNKAVMKKGMTLPIGVLLRVLADTCGGLHAAHELKDAEGHNLGVVHRDVSPQNILVSTRGVAKLIDFGIAKARDRVAGETNAGLLKGKIQYMAPEQALGKTVDRRADVWAIGSIIYHLVSGRPPYEGENQLATLHMLTSGKPPIPMPPTVPNPIRELVKKALAHDPEQRYASAAELQAAIEQAMIDAGVSTTTAAVAAYVAEHLGERTAKRKEAVDLALKAAAERQRMQALLQPPSSESMSGVLTNALTQQLTPGGMRISGMPPPPSSHPGALVVPPALYPSAIPPPPPTVREGNGNGPPSSETSNTSNLTLGSTALARPTTLAPPGASRRRGLVVGMAAAAVALVAAAAIAIGIVATRGSGTTDAAAAARPPSTSSAAPTESAVATTTSSAIATAEPPAPSASEATDDASADDKTATAATTKPRWNGWGPAPKPTTHATAAPPATTAAPPATTVAKPPPKPGVVDDGF